MSNLKTRLARLSMEQELTSLYKITEGDVQSTAVKGYPIGGQPTNMPQGVATATTAPTPQPGHAGSVPSPDQPNTPAVQDLTDAGGEQVCATSGSEHVAAETELFNTVSEIIDAFNGFMSGCEGEQYTQIKATAEQLKSQLASHLASYSQQLAPETQAPIDPTQDQSQATTTIAPAQSVDESKLTEATEHTFIIQTGASVNRGVRLTQATLNDLARALDDGRSDLSDLTEWLADHYMTQQPEGFEPIDYSVVNSGDGYIDVDIQWMQCYTGKNPERRRERIRVFQDHVTESSKANASLMESERGEFFESRLYDDECVYYIGPGHSDAEGGDEPSGDYIYFADLRGDGNYIEFVIDNRVSNTIDMPEFGNIRREFGQAIHEWVVTLAGGSESEDLKHETDLITLAYMQAVKSAEQNNRR